MTLGKWEQWFPFGEHFSRSGPCGWDPFVIFANILNEDTLQQQILWIGLISSQPLPGMQCLGSQKLHFLDFLTAWVVDMSYLPSIRCIRKRFGGWKWIRIYPSTHFWWLSCKQGHCDTVCQQQCYRVCSWNSWVSRVRVPVPSHQSSEWQDGVVWWQWRLQRQYQKVPGLASCSPVDSRYELIPLMVNSTMLFWESFLEAQSKTRSSVEVCISI